MQNRMNATERVSLCHGLFNTAAGMWPVINRETFEAVTGPKKDFWLVRTVGLLITTTGVVMTAAAVRRAVSPEVQMLGIATAGVLSGVDINYASKRRISRIYLLDALVEIGIVAAWVTARRATERHRV